MVEGISKYTPVVEKWKQVPCFTRLTEREMHFLTLVVNGLTNPQIAEAVGAKTNLVHRVVQGAYDKIKGIDGVGELMAAYSNRQDIASLLIKAGFFEPTPSKE